MEKAVLEHIIKQMGEIPGIQISFDSNIEKVNFSDWGKQWLAVYKQGLVKDNTLRGIYQEPLELHLIPYFGSFLLDEITPLEVQIYFKTLSNKLSLETQKKIKNTLRLIFDSAIECGKCQRNPVTKTLRLVSNLPVTRKNVWTPDEYRIAYHYAITHPYGLDILTLMETAITRSELLGLHWRNYNPQSRSILIENGLVALKSSQTGLYELVNEGVKNQHRMREIPISSFLNGLLSLKPREIYVRQKDGTSQKVRPQFIFHSPSGGPYDPNNWYKRVLQRFMKDLHTAHPEVPILTTHELRHTRATILANEGKNLFAISKLLGHCDLNMLAKRYAHGNTEALRVALEL